MQRKKQKIGSLEKMRQKETKDQPLVSILTPVYNGEKFLRECIESVLKQDYENWEYILVNNKSTDSSLQIMQKYAELDDRINIHDNERFLPQMQNFNHTFRQVSAHSKYCKMICADDWIFPECLTKMVEVAEQYPTVGIVSSYLLSGSRVHLDGLPYPSNFIPGREMARKYLLKGNSKFGSPTTILFRSDLIRNRKKVFEESHQASDTGACIELLKESDFGFVHQVLSYTRRHENSVTNTEAKQSYAFIHAKLFNQLAYGPFFLTEQELKRSFSKVANRFYILLAKNLFQTKSIEEFKRQLQVLEKLGLKFQTGKFIKNLTREAFVQVFKKTRAKLRKTS